MIVPFRLILLLVFIAIPLIEIVLLIKVGQAIGVLATIAIVIGTAVLGTTLLYQQGFGVLGRAKEAMRRRNAPVVEVVEGVFLLVAGAFLLTPGLLTDSIGFTLLVPPLRRGLAKWTIKRLISEGAINVTIFGAGDDADEPDFADGSRRPDGKGTVIEGEYERVDERTMRPDGKNGRAGRGGGRRR